MHSKSRKKLVLTGASLFNAKPKNGLAFLEENKLIYADDPAEVSRARSLAMFLKGCNRLDKRLLGDFISKPDNIEVLKAFIGLFDFKDVSVTPRNGCIDVLNLTCSRNLLPTLCGNSWKPLGYRASRNKYPALLRPLLQSILPPNQVGWDSSTCTFDR